MNSVLNFVVNKNKFILRNKFIILYIFFLFPISININEFRGLHINFFFCLIPIYYFFFKKLSKPPIDLQIIISFYLLLFLFHTILNFDFFFKKFFLFFIFVSIFSFAFLKISDRRIKDFKLSICIFSFFYFLIKIVSLIFLTEGNGTYFSGNFLFKITKANFGSKYEGIVYLFSFWIIFFYNFNYKFGKLLKFLTLIFILFFLFLTYSKASILTLFFSSIIFLLGDIKNKSIDFKKKSIIFFFLLLFLIFILELYFKFYTENFKEMIKFLYDFNLNDFNSEDSTGYRLRIILELSNLSLKDFLFGASYLGINSISDGLIGSSHNQYVDIFLRSGFFGLFFYLLLLYRILIFLKNYDNSLYYGFISILIYSFFLETFRLSFGAFLLCFIIGIYAQKTKKYF